MNCSFNDPRVQTVLDRLHAEAETNDPPILAAAMRTNEGRGGLRADSDIASLLGDAYIPVPPEVGQFVYILVRSAGCRKVVEFGTSFGISTIYLAAAVRDQGGGKVISTEINPQKAQRARQHIEEAGLTEYVEILQGVAVQTLRAIGGPVDLLLLDGWKDLYLPVLKVVEPALRRSALVVADDLEIFPEAHKPFLEYIRNPGNGYFSIEVPLGDRLALALRCQDSNF